MRRHAASRLHLGDQTELTYLRIISFQALVALLSVNCTGQERECVSQTTLSQHRGNRPPEQRCRSSVEFARR